LITRAPHFSQQALAASMRDRGPPSFGARQPCLSEQQSRVLARIALKIGTEVPRHRSSAPAAQIQPGQSAAGKRPVQGGGHPNGRTVIGD